MFVHPDPELEGKNNLGLEDVNGKPIIKWSIDKVTRYEGQAEGWTHYLWPKPREILPAWKTTFVKLAIALDGKKYIVNSGNYNMSMEEAFVQDFPLLFFRSLKVSQTHCLGVFSYAALCHFDPPFG